MKRFLPILLFTFSILFSIRSKADDILIPFGQNLASPPTWKYRGGGTNLDAIAWKTLAYGEPSWVSGGSALGYGASAPVHNTNIPEDNSAGGGGASGSRYPTMYFRKVINIPSLAGYTSFQIRAQFDDAIVIWINGQQAYINNIAAAPAYATWATGAISGNGSTIFTVSVPKSFFVEEDNIIAVEIHQVNAGSSDLFFDMELTGISVAAGVDQSFFPFGQDLTTAPFWKYKGGGTNLDLVVPSWKTIGYTEPSWLTSKSALGFGTNPPNYNTSIPENTTAGGGGASGARYPTLYFRKKVYVTDPNIFAAFKIDAKFDDGIVIWVNGQEAFRNNIGANPVYADWAPTAISGDGATVFTTNVATSMFVAGYNIIAVEIHQNAITSSDLFFDMALTGLATAAPPATPVIQRGPYLQMGNQTSINIRWQTDIASDSKVTWGTVMGTYPNQVTNATSSVDHELTITGLTADTKYFYTVGTTTTIVEATANNFFVTLPPTNSTRKIRVLALGDCGTAVTNQADVRDAFIKYATPRNISPDALMLLGDNAYENGLQTEYTSGFFGMYSGTLLKNLKLYPTPGNHDYANNSGNLQNRALPYYNNFTVPTTGQIGGVASNTESYYSYDIGDIHFVSLDSYGTENGAAGTKVYDTAIGNRQIDWLRSDLTANTKRWTIVYCHHMPYTKGSHNSDTESDLREIHDSLVPVLERFGVDMLVNGHSHCYERSYLMKNLYGNSTSYVAATNLVSNSSAMYNGLANSCPYVYPSGKTKHGTMYIVAGSSGKVGGSTPGWPLPFMKTTNNTNSGCFYFEVDSNRLDAKFISYTGTGASVVPNLLDSFTIFKDVNKTTNLVATQNVPLTLTASWRGTYVWPANGGATTQDVTIPNTTAGTFSYTVRDSRTCIQDVFNVTVTPPLPVLITSFTASLNKDIVLLDWASSQEINNKFFTIERSTDGNNFSLLGNVNAAGNSSVSKNYHMNDLQPVEGLNYYRLSQTDMDGRKEFVGVKRVTYKSLKNLSATVVNTAPGLINVTVHNANGGLLQMKVVDMLGREILSRSFNSGTANISQSIQLQKGTYVLILANNSGEKISAKIISD